VIAQQWPERMCLRPLLAVESRVKNGVERRTAEVEFDDPGIGVEIAHQAPHLIALRGRRIANLVDDDDVGEFDPFDQKIDQGAVIDDHRDLRGCSGRG
jgi:hypothetical protein